MQDIKLYAFTLFCCSAAAAFVEFLTPDGMKKQTSYITGMLILLCMLSPLRHSADITITPLLDVEPLPVQAISTDELIKEEAAFRLTKIIQDKLGEIGIFASDIRIEINMSGEEADIRRVEVVLEESCAERAGEAALLLEHELGLKAGVLRFGR